MGLIIGWMCIIILLLSFVLGMLFGGRYADRFWYEDGDGVFNPDLEKKWYDLH